ncbi:MAG: HEPN domain-containing protein [Rubrobacter sp.]|jgi:hypothetical protein|nr:HEPN domain-containing protein [Rubrobacter sp.]
MQRERDLEADLDWLVGRIRDGYEPEKIILFGSLYAHQSAEKYLRGLLALHEREEPPKIHNLRLLSPMLPNTCGS